MMRFGRILLSATTLLTLSLLGIVCVARLTGRPFHWGRCSLGDAGFGGDGLRFFLSLHGEGVDLIWSRSDVLVPRVSLTVGQVVALALAASVTRAVIAV